MTERKHDGAQESSLYPNAPNTLDKAPVGGSFLFSKNCGPNTRGRTLTFLTYSQRHILQSPCTSAVNSCSKRRQLPWAQFSRKRTEPLLNLRQGKVLTNFSLQSYDDPAWLSKWRGTMFTVLWEHRGDIELARLKLEWTFESSKGFWTLKISLKRPVKYPVKVPVKVL